MLTLELVDEMVNETVVEILTTKMGVTSGGLDLEDTLLNGQERHIEGTTTQIEDEDVALALSPLVETVGNGSGSGLVDDAHDVEAGNETGVLGSLTLRVVEVGGDSDDGILDGVTKVGLGSLPHLGQDHGGDLLRGEDLGLALELDLDGGLASLVDNREGEVLHVGLDLSIAELAADETLGIEDGVGGVHGHLVLGGITDQTLGVGEGNERGGGAVTLVVGDNVASCKKLAIARRDWLEQQRGAYRSSRKTPTQEYVVPRSIPTAGAIVDDYERSCFVLGLDLTCVQEKTREKGK